MEYPLLSPLAADFTLFGGVDAVLLIHGFTGSPAQMLPLGRALNRAGFTVRGIRLTGHGTSVEDMKKATARDWLNDARETYDALKAAFRTVSVAGLSMGGVLSLILAEESDPACCVSLSAPMGTANPFSHLAPVLGRVLPVIGKRDPEEEKKLLDAEYDIDYGQMPVPQLTDLNRLIRTARKGLKDLRCPILCVQSEKDRAIIKASADIILRGVSSGTREKLTLIRSPHVITIGPETERLFPAVADFMVRHTAEAQEAPAGPASSSNPDNDTKENTDT